MDLPISAPEPKATPATEEPRPRVSRPGWAARLQNDEGRIRSELPVVAITLAARRDLEVAAAVARSTGGSGSSETGSARLEGIREDLDAADRVLSRHLQLPWWRRLIRATSSYQEAQGHVQRAGENLFLVHDDAAVAGRLPALRAAVLSSLAADDPRRDGYLRRIDAALAAIESERVAALQGAVPSQRSTGAANTPSARADTADA